MSAFVADDFGTADPDGEEARVPIAVPVLNPLLRYPDGEEEAKLAYRLNQDSGGVYESPEIVAIGFPDSEEISGDSGPVRSVVTGMTWVRLNNIADPSVAAHRFTVDGLEVQELLKTMERRPYVLWHSHMDLDYPSKVDTESFPGWLVEVGIVFCARTGTVAVYDANGIIFQ